MDHKTEPTFTEHLRRPRTPPLVRGGQGQTARDLLRNADLCIWLAAAAEAKAALGVTITANNVLGVAEALGLAPLLDDRGNGTVRLTPEFAAQVKAAGELTVETLGTLQTTMQALVEGMARLEKQMAELQQR